MHRILSTRIANDQALARARDRTRQIGEAFGLDKLQCTRLITAVSEIARNAVDYADGGKIEYYFRPVGAETSQAVVVMVTDEGKGIAALAEVLAGAVRRRGKTAVGILGSQRLVDKMAIDTSPRGTKVTLEMRLNSAAPPISPAQLAHLAERLAQRKPQSMVEELEEQNREMLLTLEELRLRQIELERNDERKDEFLAMLAHELRNPLSAIGTALELLKRRANPSPADIQRLIGLVSRQSDQLAHLVNDLLDVARVTRGKIDLAVEPLSVAELIEHALEMTQGAIAKKNHTVQYTPPPVDLWIKADRIRFRQILGNLLHNAVRYTPDSGIIRITVAQRGPSVCIDIEDNGIGIDADMLPRVFDLFTQGDTGLARQDAGLGIGLTLVRRLLDAHGGSVRVHSAGPGQGSTFVVEMPLGERGALPAAVERVRSAPSATGNARVLLVDDNLDALQAMRQLLEEAGHQVVVAQTGMAGVAAAESFMPHCVVVDVGLPGMDGFQVASALRGSPGTSHSILIALSGYTAPAMRERGRAAGFDHYLVKPVDITQLESLLEAVPR